MQGATKHKRWFLDALAELHHTRFLLQPAALEVFVHDRSNALLSFPSHKACLFSPTYCKLPKALWQNRRIALLAGQRFLRPHCIVDLRWCLKRTCWLVLSRHCASI